MTQLFVRHDAHGGEVYLKPYLQQVCKSVCNPINEITARKITDNLNNRIEEFELNGTRVGIRDTFKNASGQTNA